jgi:hypothetical protein
MSNYKPATYLLVLFFACFIQLAGYAQNCDILTRPQLKEKLQQMGFDVKTLSDKPGEEKYSVDHPGSVFNVPVGYEISPSTNFIWLTVFLGKADSLDGEKSLSILKENGNIQPSFFYITAKGNLMMGVGIENRGVTEAILRRHINKLVADVSKTSETWR